MSFTTNKAAETSCKYNILTFNSYLHIQQLWSSSIIYMESPLVSNSCGKYPAL